MAAAFITLAAVFLMMLIEGQLSRHNERVLRSRGAIEPSDDGYRVMRWVYPACFLAMGVEAGVVGPKARDTILAGLAIFGLAKALKFWAIASLGIRWSFHVLVLPGAPLVSTGPYRYLRHPNYVALCGEIVGIAVMLGAWVSGLAALICFGYLLRRRIAIEERVMAEIVPRSEPRPT